MPAPSQRGAVTALTETPESPKWTFGERVICERIFRAPYGVAYAARVFRGTRPVPPSPLAVAAGVGYLLVDECTLTREPTDLGVLTVRYTGQLDGQEMPADEVQIDLEKIEIPLERHPRYRDQFTEQQLNDVHDLLATTDATVRAAADYIFTPTDPDYVALLHEFYLKLKRGFTHYVLYTPVVRLTQHFLASPGDLVIGGFRQTPTLAMPIQLPDAEWMRQGDSIQWNGNHWVVTRSWLGGEHLDREVYPEPEPT